MAPPIGGVRAVGGTSSRHFLGGSDSVKILGVQGLVWSGTCLFMSLQFDVNELVNDSQ